jgi:hypothetical protein
MLKLARGAVSQDELEEILAAVGMKLAFSPAAPTIEGFRPLAQSASLPGAKMIELKGKMKGGGTLHALLVMNSDSTAVAAHHKGV